MGRPWRIRLVGRFVRTRNNVVFVLLRERAVSANDGHSCGVVGWVGEDNWFRIKSNLKQAFLCMYSDLSEELLRHWNIKEQGAESDSSSLLGDIYDFPPNTRHLLCGLNLFWSWQGCDVNKAGTWHEPGCCTVQVAHYHRLGWISDGWVQNRAKGQTSA